MNTILGVSLLVLGALIAGILIGATLSNHDHNDDW